MVNGLGYVKEPHLLPTSVLSDTQVKDLFGRIQTDHAEGYRDRAMLELLYSSGLRAGELLGLNVADVDLQNGTAIVLGKGQQATGGTGREDRPASFGKLSPGRSAISGTGAE